MKLLFKHLAKSIRQRPLQPIILILTLTLSIATAIFAFTINDLITNDVEAAQTAKYGNASIMIRVGNSSDSRFLFADDVLDVLGESAKVAGCYDLPVVLRDTGDTTIAMATEFHRISDVFDIKFSSYGQVTESTVDRVAFISESFAAAQGLSINDTLTVETMGYTKEYRVQGICADRFLASYDVMVDISSVIGAFADQSLLFAAIGEDFKPCGKVYVHIDDAEKTTVPDIMNRLKADARFSEKIFEDLSNVEKKNANHVLLDVIVKFAVVLAALLSAVIAFCCLYILANERAQENLVLTYSGVGPRLLGGIQYAEVLFYWMLSLPLGVLAAIPITRMIAVFVNLQYVKVSIYPLTVLKSALIILAVCLLTTTFFLKMNKHIRRTGAKASGIRLKWILWLLGATAVLFILLYVLPAKLRIITFIALMTAIIALIFLAVPILLHWISYAIDKRSRGTPKNANLVLQYALKNACSLKLLHNIARLCALIVAIILMITFTFSCARGWIRPWKHIFHADYAITNATDRCYEKTTSCESADAVYRSYMSWSELGMVVCADDPSVYSDSFSIEALPQGQQAIISSGVAHRLDIKQGESFLLELDGVTYELVAIAIEKVGINYIAINCKDLGIPYNMLLVDGKDGVSSADLLADLSKVTSTELTGIVSIDSLLEQRIRSMEIYVNAGKILLFVFLAFSLIGIVNIFYESLRSRKEEFGLYLLAGMNRKELGLMKLLELAFAVFVGILIGIAAFIFAALAMNRGMNALGAELFLGMRQLFN